MRYYKGVYMALVEIPKLPSLKVGSSCYKDITYYYVQTYTHHYDPVKKHSIRDSQKTVGTIKGNQKYGEIEFRPEFIKQYPQLESFVAYKTEKGIEFKPIDDDLTTVIKASKIEKKIGGTTWAVNQALAQTGIGNALRDTFSKDHRHLKFASIVNYMIQIKTAVIHIIARFGYNGLRGVSIFDENRTAFETSRALDSYTDYSFKNQIGGKRLMIDISKAYPNATQDEINLLRAKYIKDYSGVENAGKPVVKTGSIDFNTIEGSDIDNRSQQLQEIKNYQQNLISELFGIPTDYLTGNTNNLESISTLFIQNAIEPICKSLEESFEKLFTPIDRERYYFEFNLNSLYRTNLQAKIDAYTKQLNNGMLSVNEIRSKENLTPIEAGDYHFVPANLLPLTEENVSAILAKSKLALIEADQKTKQENAEGAGTVAGLGSDKS